MPKNGYKNRYWSQPLLVPTITMPSHRSRSRSRSPRDRSKSPERRYKLPHGVSEISESDYFAKSAEFRVWLKDEKGKVYLRARGSSEMNKPCRQKLERGGVAAFLKGIAGAGWHSTPGYNELTTSLLVY